MFTRNILFFALAAAASVQAGKPANTVCTCEIMGDPHLTNFMGGKYDYGKGWTHMAKSADCFVNVQTYTKGKHEVNEKVGIRIEDSWVLVDHVNLQVVKQNLLNGVTVGTDTLEGQPGLVIDGPNVRVEVYQHHRTVLVHYMDNLLASQSGGYCGSCNRAKYDTCGVDSEDDWKVPAGMVIWEQAEANACTQDSLCDAYACTVPDVADVAAEATAPAPAIDVQLPEVTPPLYPGEETPTPEEVQNDVLPTPAPAPVEVGYESGPKCTRRLRRRKLQELVPIDLNTCDAAETDCKNVGHDFWLKAVAHCRPQVETNWWQMDCNCLRDLCVLNDFSDGADNSSERPCEEPKVTKENIVEHTDGFDYATLDFAAPNGPSGQCHWSHDFQPLAKVPSGWEIAPGNNENVAEMLKSNSFGADCIMGSDDFAYPVGGKKTEDCTGFSLGKKHLDYHMCYTVTECPSRVLIRRKTATTECTSSSIEFQIQDRKIPISDASSVQDHLKLMKQQDGTNYAFVRSENTNQIHLCVSTKTGLTSTIQTTPAYGVSWIGHEEAMVPAGGSDIFLPLIHGNKMHSVQQSAGGFCVGPLNVSPNMCLDISVSKSIAFGSETFSSSNFKACPVCSTA